MSSEALPLRSVTRLEVENQVSRFWRFFTEKQYEQLRDCYSAEAQVFGTVTDRAESALTASSRRNIEYFADHMKIQAHLGTITVQLMGERVAIASYTFSFSAVEIYRYTLRVVLTTTKSSARGGLPRFLSCTGTTLFSSHMSIFRFLTKDRSAGVTET
jgi:hypothetical protein